MTVAEPHPARPSEVRAVAAYRQVREATAALLAQGPPGVGAEPVAHCPGWTVRDLVAHLVEICARVHGRVTGSTPGPVPDGGLPELLDEWERLSGPVEEFLAGPGSMDRNILVMDAFTHELDLRQALGVPPPVDHPALPVASGVLLTGLSASLDGHGLPPLTVETEHGRHVAGTGVPVATMSGPWHEVYLSLAGRRTTAQIRSLRWSADPGRWLPAFTWGPFRVPESAVAEPAR
ncbi:maleylpyruvate isomerase family mycothiol-dependent enzyme [Micromonospora sp. NBC_01655]|uniref:maleylpyruvate isomerase family mycothiol-dependent enzyme n=1 Tax=Micromonospora sp. NBC_01655 TaxID=2975983 RepID=UPI0022533EA8|nr:maleylpyruvate isomerase family mycothiol-dependent enzyme [Micromonospora sp. NBC_01655]MCX4472228.1 maleylpyruvate isomerase family mycothiol-dependent enzyme [Micromonospora sp. NBC_01655]